MDSITKLEWEKMSGKARWDCLVSMRGPDCHGSELIKFFSTGVLRSRMSGVIRTGGSINPYLNVILIPSSMPRSEFCWEHFFQHIHEAATWLGIKVIHVPQDIWMKAMKKEHPLGAGKVFYNWAEDQQNTKLMEELDNCMIHQFGTHWKEAGL